eukprot:TRINITY_DN192_c0_g2_i1.p1 TRINITY_DN192_c0_g2~~TRINITY_DN192_c0_g2_i1.p1  ORF type:complete len:160 (+),score=42.37 TRINITY_DN192_c0_g2_i1:48-527(+)
MSAAMQTAAAPIQYVQQYAPQSVQYMPEPAQMYMSQPVQYTVDPGQQYLQQPVQYMVDPAMYMPQGMPVMEGLDHTQGKWFAPGEAIPEGWAVTAHPEGAMQENHSMTEAARAQSFVATGMDGTGAAVEAAAKELAATTTKKSSTKKSSKKKKTKSGCC